MRWWLTIALLPLFACGDGGGGGGGVACTEIGCTDGLTLRLFAPEDGFRDGAYEATFTLDGETSTCTWTVLGSPSGECEGAVFTSGQIALTFVDTPTDVTFAITLDGAEVAGDTLTPTYDVVQPNGPDCEPTCRQATAEVTL